MKIDIIAMNLSKGPSVLPLGRIYNAGLGEPLLGMVDLETLGTLLGAQLSVAQSTEPGK